MSNAPNGNPPLEPSWREQARLAIQQRFRYAVLAAFVPWWLRYILFPRAGTQHPWEQLKQDLQTLRTIGSRNQWNPFTVYYNIMGGWSPLSPNYQRDLDIRSEKAFTFRTVRNILIILTLEILFLVVGSIIAFIPVVCAILPLIDLITQLLYSDVAVFPLLEEPVNGVLDILPIGQTARNAIKTAVETKLFNSADPVSADHKERWFFLNGMYNTQDFAEDGRTRLGNLLGGKDIRLLFRPTRGFFRDVWECYTGRSLGWPTIPAFIDRLQILKAIRNPDVKKVVIIGHSQGTIITAEIMDALVSADPGDHKPALTTQQLGKIEITLLACCAAQLTQPERFKRVEIFGNLRDPVYQLSLGVQEGNHHVIRYTNDRNGHLLNAHYLHDFEYTPYVNAGHHDNQDVPTHGSGGLYSYLPVRNLEPRNPDTTFWQVVKSFLASQGADITFKFSRAVQSSYVSNFVSFLKHSLSNA